MKDLYKRIMQYSTCEVSDGMPRLAAMDYTIKPLVVNKKICGPALTLDMPTLSCVKVMDALAVAKPGQVLVIAAHGNCETVMWGDFRSKIAMKKQLAGLVIDGVFRDIDEVKEIGFPIFAKGICPAADFSNNEGSVNVPVTCAGVTVNPGDIVFGDANGVVVLPPDKEFIETALAKADAKTKAQNAKLAALEEEYV